MKKKTKQELEKIKKQKKIDRWFKKHQAEVPYMHFNVGYFDTVC